MSLSFYFFLRSILIEFSFVFIRFHFNFFSFLFYHLHFNRLAGKPPSYMLEVSPVFDDDWFGSADIETNHVVTSRWAHALMPKNLQAEAGVQNSYGLIRSYWNNNPDEGTHSTSNAHNNTILFLFLSHSIKIFVYFLVQILNNIFYVPKKE